MYRIYVSKLSLVVCLEKHGDAYNKNIGLAIICQ